MVREGTVTVVGAGASAPAGYPTAAEILNLFRDSLRKATESELKHRERVLQIRSAPKREVAKPSHHTTTLWEHLPPTSGESFDELWSRFETAAHRLRPLAVPKIRPDGRPELPGPVVSSPAGLPTFPPYPAPVEGEAVTQTQIPYLETFFAFYDDYMRPIIASVEGDPGALRTMQHQLRTLRDIAVLTAFRHLSSYNRAPPFYLRQLFDLRAPNGLACAIATLNFDVSLTALAAPGFAFDHWSGDVSGAEVAVVVTMDGDKAITAHFKVKAPSLNIQ